MGLPQAGYVITVGGMNASWVPGEALIFDDSLEHEVFSPPEAGVPSMRVVLIVDVRRSRPCLQALPCLPAGPPRVTPGVATNAGSMASQVHHPDLLMRERRRMQPYGAR